MVRYYKKITVEKAWTQPIATTYNGSDVNSAFGVLGGDSFAVLGDSYWDTRTYLWKAFDGQVTPTNTAYWQTGAGGNHWVKWYNPIALKVSSIKIYNISATSYNVAGGSIYGSDDGVNWELLRTFTGNQTASAVQNITVSANHKYGKIEFTNTSQLSIKELQIIATTLEHKWVECSKSEYDQLTDDNRKIVTDIFSAFVDKSGKRFYCNQKIGYKEKSTTIETINDYAHSTDKKNITVTPGTNLSQEQAENILNGVSVFPLPNSSTAYEVVYTFEDLIKLNSINFTTGTSGMAKFPVSKLIVNIWVNNQWVEVLNVKYTGSYSDRVSYGLNADTNMSILSALFTHKVKLTLYGNTYAPNTVYYAEFRNLKFNVDRQISVEAKSYAISQLGGVNVR